MVKLYRAAKVVAVCITLIVSTGYSGTVKRIGKTQPTHSLALKSKKKSKTATVSHIRKANAQPASKTEWHNRVAAHYSQTHKALQSTSRKFRTASLRRRMRPKSVGAITVNTTADDPANDVSTSDTTAGGAVSLRSAIQYANFNPGPDTIIVPAGTYVLTTTGVDEQDAATGDLNINDTLTIIGAGIGATVIDGNATDRVFAIDNYSLGIVCTISGVTIVDGISTGTENGGGIEVYAGTLDLENVAVMSNTAGGYGGGIDMEFGSLIMNGGMLSYNTAPGQSGGGANIGGGSATFTNVLIDSNSAAWAGGICNLSIPNPASVLIDSCTFLGDQTTAQDGGAALNDGGYMEIDNSVVKYCSALDVGGIGIYGGTGLITNTVVDSNFAGDFVGGVAIVPFSGANSLVMTGDSVAFNEADNGEGGGIYTAPVGYFTFSNGTIYGNFATQQGGGMLLDAGVDSIINSRLSNNFSVGGGGGFENYGASQVVMSNVLIDSNGSGNNGGGIEDEHGSVFWFDGALNYNTASADGGAIYFNASSANDTLVGVTLQGNSLPDIFNNSASYSVIIVGEETATLTAPVFTDTTGVQFNGVVNPGDSTLSSIYFLYGNAPGVYSDSVAASPSFAGPGGAVTVSATLSGLNPSESYYYVLSISTNGGFHVQTNEANFHTGVQTVNGFSFSSAQSSFNSISGSGTAVGASGWDDNTQTDILIGFTFYYYGVPYSMVAACSNGWLSFDSITTSTTNGYSTPHDLTSDASMWPFVTPLFGDLLVNGDIYYETTGSAPNREFIIEWNNVAADYNYSGSNSLSFQVILTESSNTIQFVYETGPQASTTFNNPSGSGLCAGIVDTAGDFVSIGRLGVFPATSSTSEFDELLSPPDDGTMFTFTPLSEVSLAVQATDFLATTDIGSVTLTWKSQSEVSNAGYNVMRQQAGDAAWQLVGSYLSSKNLQGLGTSSTGRNYSFTDSKVKSGATYNYKIQSVSTQGTMKDLTTLTVTVDVPKSYALYQNYPNPFNPSTTIRFDLKESSAVTLEVYNTLGQRVDYMDYGTMDAGRYNETVDMSRFASGIYFYRVIATGSKGDKFTSIKKLVLMK